MDVEHYVARYANVNPFVSVVGTADDVVPLVRIVASCSLVESINVVGKVLSMEKIAR